MKKSSQSARPKVPRKRAAAAPKKASARDGSGPVAQLERRVREQAVSARFSLDALQARNIQTVFDDAAHILRENMKVDFSAIFALSPNEKSMRLCAGAGWRPGDVGSIEITVDEKTPMGRALQLNQPIIIGDVRRDRRLSLPKFMRDRGVASSMAVVVPGRSGAFGALGVDSQVAPRLQLGGSALSRINRQHPRHRHLAFAI